MAPSDLLESASPIARWMITLATVAYGAGTFAVDFNRTHLLHPAWPGHARFHLAWASITQFFTSLIALWLVWSGGPDLRWRCQLALLIGLGYVVAFFIAWMGARFYRGTLSDPGGIPPIAGIEGNVVACLLIGGMLVAAWLTL
jgi:hypothetical protein